jgi:hypothetical protein
MSAEATAAYHRDRGNGFGTLRDAYEHGYETGRADERAKLSAVISPERLRDLAGWFDDDDALKMLLAAADESLPVAWRQREHGLQDDLRKIADVLRQDGAG